MTLHQLTTNAIGKLREWHRDNPGETAPHVRIIEIVDASVPVNIHELLRLASENIHLAVDDPDHGPANGINFDGTASPMNLIAANVLECIQQALWDAWDEMMNEDLEADDDAA